MSESSVAQSEAAEVGRWADRTRASARVLLVVLGVAVIAAAFGQRWAVADLAVDWLVVDTSTDPTSGTAHTARFHQTCRPAGIPGELACAGCGDGPLLDPTLTAVLDGKGDQVDLFTVGALTGWLDDHGWIGDPHSAAGAASAFEDPAAGEGPRCPACSPRLTWSRTSATAGGAR